MIEHVAYPKLILIGVISLLSGAAVAEIQWFMPIWAQVIVSISILVVAVGVLWKKVLKPMAKLVALLDKSLPVLKELVIRFEDQPHAFKILNEVAAQFRTDSGSSLRDVVNRLEQAANENKSSAIRLGVNLEGERKLAEQNREAMRRLADLVNKISRKVSETGSDVSELQEGARHIAVELAAAQNRAEDVPTASEPGQPENNL